MRDLGTKGGPRGLIFFFVAIGLALFLLPFSVQHALRPANSFRSGSLDSALIWAPLFIMFVYMLFASTAVVQRTGREDSLDVLREICAKPAVFVTMAVLASGFTVYSFGFFAYWTAGADGVTLHAPWRRRLTHYAWPDIKARSMDCYPVKGGIYTSFVVVFSDGWHVDLAGGSNDPGFIDLAPKLLLLTQGAGRTDIGRIEPCPPSLRHIYLAERVRLRSQSKS